MFRRLFIFMMLLAACLTAYAVPAMPDTAEEDTVINIIADFCKNDTMTYTVNDIEYKVEEGDTIVEHDIETDFMLIVRDSTSTGYTLELAETDMRINQVSDDAMKAMYESAWDMAKGMACLFSTNEYGEVKNIINWRDIRDRIKKMQTTVYDTLFARFEGLDSILSRNRLEQMTMMKITSEEALRKGMYDELELLFGCHGRAWDICDKQWEDDSNGYKTGHTIKVGYTTQDNETDLDGDYAIWSLTRTSIPIEDAIELGLGYYGSLMTDNLNDEIQKQKQAMTDAIKAEIAEATVELTEYYSYFYNGWPKECHKIKNTSVGNSHQTITINSIVWNSRSWYNH